MGIESIIRADWLWVFGSFFSVFVCSIPHIVEKRLSLHIPWFLELSITVAVFLHAGGAYLGFYGSIPGYDHITHSVSSVVVALLALVTTYMLSKYSDAFKLPPLFIGLFVVILSMAFGVVWEMLEWILDHFTGAGAQYGNEDTMWDLVFDTIGGLIVGILGGLGIKHKSLDELLEPMEVDIIEILKTKEEGERFPSLPARDLEFE